MELVGILWGLGGGFTVFGVVWAFTLWWVGGLWDRPERHAVAFWLNQDRLGQIYSGIITTVLDAVSRFLGQRELRLRADQNFQQPDADILARNKLPWSWGLLDMALLMAIAYPVFSVIFQWIALGEGRLGTLTILPQADWKDRWLPALLLLASLMCYGFAVTFKIRWPRASFIPAIGFYVWFIFELDVLAVAFASAVAVALAFAGAVAVAVAFALAGAGASAVAGAGTVAVAGAGAVAVAGDWLRARWEARLERPALALLLWIGVLFVALATTAILLQPQDRDRVGEVAAPLLFIGFLPLLNAMADFASIGLTRHFLARGAAGHPGWFGAVDVFFGALTFLCLGCAMICTVALVKTLGGSELIDLGTLLGDANKPGSILADPHAYWWLYVTFLSTLLPTVLHLFIAAFAFAAMWPKWLREKIATGLNSGTALYGKPACLTLSVMMALSVAVPLTLLYYPGLALLTYSPHAGDTLIWIFRGFATLTGAIDTP